MNQVPIDNIDHATLRVTPAAGAAFGDATNQAMIFPAEFEEVQREFPIVFRRRESGIQAFALLGLDRGENLLLSGAQWTSRYVPATHQRGPFSIGVSPGGNGAYEEEPVVYIDLDDPRVSEKEGLPLFLKHGGYTPYLNHVSSVLRLIFRETQRAPAAYAALEEAGLLAPVTLSIDISDEVRYTVPDVLVVDVERLAMISGDELQHYYSTGILRLALFAAASLGNVQQLIARKRSLLAPSK